MGTSPHTPSSFCDQGEARLRREPKRLHLKKSAFVLHACDKVQSEYNFYFIFKENLTIFYTINKIKIIFINKSKLTKCNCFSIYLNKYTLSKINLCFGFIFGALPQTPLLLLPQRSKKAAF